MLPALLALAALNLLCLIALLLRKPPVPEQDPRLAQIPEQITRLEAHFQGLDHHLRSELALLRADSATQAQHARAAADAAAAALRTEVTGAITTLGTTLTTGLESFRQDNTNAASALRKDVQQQLESQANRFTAFTSDAARAQLDARDALNTRLNELSNAAKQQQESLRAAVEERLDKLNQANTAKLEEMRQTVDEKLHATLQTRLTESFGQVTTHLGEVQKGLGEMKELATGVSDLKKVFSNVKSRGIVGEFQLGQQLEQMFSPEQYVRNARIKPGTTEAVEYALKFPAADGTAVLLAIDSKFPREDWERLEDAYERGSAEEIAAAGKNFERAIRSQAKLISDKYIDPPATMPHAVMFLPTESLYAEVVRRPGLLSEVQQTHRVTIAGPATFMAILTSFQMGFHTLAIQKKGDEVWRVLSRAKSEFEKFGGLMDKVEKQVGTVQTTLREIGSKTTTINRALREVASLDTAALESTGPGVAPLLAAAADTE
ncbi:MAG: DNA recombination protein RmuC [Acidobacteriota bacterium]|nr:DNA recombination protein RmuC [Acidobacteriota bacterium]